MKRILLSALFIMSVSSVAFAGGRCVDPGTDVTLNRTSTNEKVAVNNDSTDKNKNLRKPVDEKS